MIGTAWGSLLVFALDPTAHEDHLSAPTQEISKVHSKGSAVYTLDPLPSSAAVVAAAVATSMDSAVSSGESDAEEDDDSAAFWAPPSLPEFGSGGRDGYYCRFRLQAGTVAGVELIGRARGSLGMSIVSRLLPGERPGAVVSVGFHKRDALMCDEHDKTLLFRAMCYGGHRSWDVDWSPENPERLLFAYVRNQAVHVHVRSPVAVPTADDDVSTIISARLGLKAVLQVRSSCPFLDGSYQWFV